MEIESQKDPTSCVSQTQTHLPECIIDKENEKDHTLYLVKLKNLPT